MIRCIPATLFAAVLSFSVFAVAPALADDIVAEPAQETQLTVETPEETVYETKPSKASLLTAWENAQRENPYTVTFEKTDEEGLYDFETTIFPYKGKIRVLNLLIHQNPAYYHSPYYNYRVDDPEEDYTGIVEVELDGLEDDFRSKYPYSYGTWNTDNALHFNVESAMWYTPKEWYEYQKSRAPKTAASDSQQQKEKPTFLKVFLSWLPMLLFIGLWVWIMIRSGSFKYKTVMERQLPFLDRSEAHMKRSEELLEEILEAVKQKK